MRLAVQHPSRLFHRQTSGCSSEQPQEAVLVVTHAMQVFDRREMKVILVARFANGEQAETARFGKDRGAERKRRSRR